MNQTDFPILTNVGQVHISLHLISCLLEADSCYGAAPIMPLLGVLCPGVHSCTLPCFDTPPPPSAPLLPPPPPVLRGQALHNERRACRGGSSLGSRRASAGSRRAGKETDRPPAPNASFTGNIQRSGRFTSLQNAVTHKQTNTLGEKRKKRKRRICFCSSAFSRGRRPGRFAAHPG